jgi:hypothetical protein
LGERQREKIISREKRTVVPLLFFSFRDYPRVKENEEKHERKHNAEQRTIVLKTFEIGTYC